MLISATITTSTVFFRMEQNECECPCECPLEVNECTGNLTNAENTLVQNNFGPHYIYIQIYNGNF